ncbi:MULTISPECIES: aminopeptidase P family N-terminal domain-containing protein [Mesorhizobium]|uniref:aminopeptidase P family N-terminal domain-containing protein n=1 Tax=Mesorhizobium TaxID=68287 RepID=UPI0014320926
MLAAVANAGLDALVVTALGHLPYLSGYDGSGGYFAPFPLIMAPGRSPTYVVRQYDEQSIRSYSCIYEIVTYMHQQDFGTVCADVLRWHGLQSRVSVLILAVGTSRWQMDTSNYRHFQREWCGNEVANNLTRGGGWISVVGADAGCRFRHRGGVFRRSRRHANAVRPWCQTKRVRL